MRLLATTIAMLALLGGAAPALASKPRLTRAAAEKAIVRYEGKGTKVSNCKRRHPGIVCYYQTRVFQAHEPFNISGFDRVVLRHGKLRVTHYTSPRVISCPKFCEGPAPPPQPSFHQEQERSSHEAQEHYAPSEPGLEPETPTEAQNMDTCEQRAKERNLAELWGGWICSPDNPEPQPIPPETESITTVAATAVVCAPLYASELAELERPGLEATALGLQEAQKRATKELEAIQAAEAAFPREVINELGETEIVPLPAHFKLEREAVEQKLGEATLQIAKERHNVIVLAEAALRERVNKGENRCLPNLPRIGCEWKSRHRTGFGVNDKEVTWALPSWTVSQSSPTAAEVNAGTVTAQAHCNSTNETMMRPSASAVLPVLLA